VSGVCGNYNQEAGDDLKTASGLVLDSATAFGDSWKLHSYCPAVGSQQVIFLQNFGNSSDEKSFLQFLLIESAVFKNANRLGY
jgi:hypothetical protein